MPAPAARTRALPETPPPAKPRPGAAVELRPAVLDLLFAGVASLPGVGPATAAAAARLLRPPPRCLDLLGHLPCGTIDPAPRARLTPADEGNMVTVLAEIEGHRAAPPGGRVPHRVLARVDGRPLHLVFFRARGDYLAARFPPGATALVHGQLGRFGDRWQIVHPEPIDARQAEGGLLPVYPTVQGLGQGRLRRILRGALERAPALPEWLAASVLQRNHWPGWLEAVRAVHRPATAETIEPSSPARRRLAFDELLARQLALALNRASRRRLPGRALAAEGRLAARLAASLPFPLTACQSRAIAEIQGELAGGAPMRRLLQGDVGSGKTVVALAAMLQAVEAGTQAALMAPTEVLAQQHAATFRRLLEPLGLGADLLTGKEPAARRRRALERLANGSATIVVGTHALFQEGVAFRDLGLVVIDEQHRFGVGQRLDLVAKARAVDVLLMTATPIPRSLVLAVYGDLATSRLDEKPPGRKPITTRAVPNERVEEVLEATGRALARDERIYWICPVIEGDDDATMAAVERHRLLAERFGAGIGLVHGRLASADKEAALASFARGDTRLLVATTVVEVGVDVPEASIIVVEHAERFGLAQLHQLRGRVGRGERPSACLLLYEPPLNAAARARLAILRETEDGFRIAEEDLRLRGPGEVLGVRQSGLPNFRFVDLTAHRDLLAAARAEAKRVLRADPTLSGERGTALRVLLHLFERHDAVRLLAAG
jgi:ATP-dependent DNA helicase RecG